MFKNRGFTLIEVLISLAILGVITAISANLFTSIISSYNKANILNELEQNGNYVMSFMTQRIRNADDILSCAEGSQCSGSTLVIKNKVTPGEDPLCTEFGFQPPDDPNPDNATQNGYIFVEDSDPLIIDSTDPNCIDPNQGEFELTNRNSGGQEYAKFGINVTNLYFTVDRTEVGSPPTVNISMDLYQGARGRETRQEYKANIHLETTVSLRY